MPTVKQTLIVTGASVALIILFFALRMPAPEVNTTVVSVGPLSSYIEEEGRTRLVNTYNISTPIQGFLQRVTLQVGDAVDAGDILFVLEPTPPPALDPRTREQARQTYAAAEAQVDLLSSDTVRVKPSMRVEFSRWGGDDLLEGRVRHVDPVGFTRYSALGVEEQRVRVFISFTSEQERWQQLGEGYRVEAKIQLWHSDSALQIPVSALFREHNRWHVFVVERGRTDLRPVKIGQRGGMKQQILSGLKQGERVVTHPPPNLKANQRVRLNGG